MLTKADDYPIHQTAEPIAFSGTDRNFYDRYFFNGYGMDGENYFALAFGVYPHLNIMDASFSVIVDGVQHNVHASKVMHFERLDLEVGPISIDVVEPLRQLRIRVDDTENGIKADLLFTGRTFPIEEPRFSRRNGTRMMMDVTRMTQNGFYEGWIEVAGERHKIEPDQYFGTRDRSWGVRPVGLGDPQPVVPEAAPQFYWLWSPLNFGDYVSFFHVNEDAEGKSWNTRAVLAPVTDNGKDGVHFSNCKAEMAYKPGTRHAASAEIFMGRLGDSEVSITLEPQFNFYMRGIGYVGSEWGHGHYKGELATGYDTIDLAGVDDSDMTSMHIQAFCKASLRIGSEPPRPGNGVLEQLILGAHSPSGFTDLFDTAK